MTITRASLVEYLFENVGLNKREARDCVTLFFDEIIRLLQQHQDLRLQKFGKFEVHYRKRRPGVNFKTGQAVEVAPHYAIVFRPGRSLKNAVRDNAYKEPSKI